MKYFHNNRLDQVEELITDYLQGNREYWKKKFKDCLTTIKREDVFNIFHKSNFDMSSIEQNFDNDNLKIVYIRHCALNHLFTNAFYTREISMNNFKACFLLQFHHYSRWKTSKIEARQVKYLREMCMKINQPILELFDSIFSVPKLDELSFDESDLKDLFK
jgi:hypothetical protein